MGHCETQEKGVSSWLRSSFHGSSLSLRNGNACHKILCITLEPISERMAGPAIRCLELAKQLANDFEVVVFSPEPAQQPYSAPLPARLQLVTGKSKSYLYALALECDGLFIQANVLKQYPNLESLNKYLVVDLYDPYLFSLLVQYQDDEVSCSSSYRLMHQVLEKHMMLADFAICASEKQRDYWIGRFCALGKVDPAVYKLDSGLRKLIDVVPFGVPAETPKSTGKAIKGVIPGIEKDDYVLLWGGGIWDWFDPLTVIRAMANLRTRIPQAKLFFMGFKSPNPHVPVMDMTKKAKELAKDLGVLNSNVFFAENWVGYDERCNYLLEADIAVSAHFDVLETRYSFRTRILDYLWSARPILTTDGDELAQLVSTSGAGMALPFEDVTAWTNAIEKMLADSAFRKNCSINAGVLAKSFSWKKVAEPLKRYYQKPYHLPKFKKITMPSLFERAHAVYSRGGKDLVLKRSKDLLNEFLR